MAGNPYYDNFKSRKSRCEFCDEEYRQTNPDIEQCPRCRKEWVEYNRKVTETKWASSRWTAQEYDQMHRAKEGRKTKRCEVCGERILRPGKTTLCEFHGREYLIRIMEQTDYRAKEGKARLIQELKDAHLNRPTDDLPPVVEEKQVIEAFDNLVLNMGRIK